MFKFGLLGFYETSEFCQKFQIRACLKRKHRPSDQQESFLICSKTQFVRIRGLPESGKQISQLIPESGKKKYRKISEFRERFYYLDQNTNFRTH